MSEARSKLTLGASEATGDSQVPSEVAIFLAALPHLLFASTFFGVSEAYGGSGLRWYPYALLMVMAAALILAWRRGWPLWSGSWAGYWLLMPLPLLSLLFRWWQWSELLYLLFVLAAGAIIFRRRPLYGLLASFPILMLMTRLFAFEFVAGGNWVWGGACLLLAVVAGAIVWRGTLRVGVLLMIGFQMVTGVAVTLGKFYLPYRFPEMGVREPPELAALVNDFVPLTLAIIAITLALLLLRPLRRLSTQGGREGGRNYALLLLGMVVTLGGLFDLRAQPRPPTAAGTLAVIALAAGLVLSLCAAVMLARAVWTEAPRRGHALLLPLLAVFAPLVVFAQATPFAPDGAYTGNFQTVVFLSYAGVILWALCALWVILRSSGPEISGMAGAQLDVDETPFLSGMEAG